MSADDMDYSEISGDEDQLVPAVFARDVEEAQRYCELLADHGIVGIVACDDVDIETDAEEAQEAQSGEVEEVAEVAEAEEVTQGAAMTRGVAVLVADGLLDEAGMVISDREDLAEFQFGEEEEEEEEDDELEFAQGIDSEFEDDTGPVDLDIFGDDKGSIGGSLGDDDDEEFKFGEDFGDDLDGDFDVG
jgi:hypothetical protein